MLLASTFEIAMSATHADIEFANISADGHWMVYNLSDANASFKSHVYLKNLSDGSTRQIALPDQLTAITRLVLSADGAKLGFLATANNAGAPQAYVFDWHSNQLQLASSTAAGQSANFGVSAFSIAGDGNSLVFGSGSNNLVAGDNNLRSDVFVKDLRTGVLTLVSHNAQGSSANGASSEAVISQNGRLALFVSSAADLPGGDGQVKHLYLNDLASNTIRLIDADANGRATGVAASAANAHFSADGSKVAYQTTSGMAIKDLQTGALLPVSGTANGGLTGIITGLSSDGRYLTFSSGRPYDKFDLDRSPNDGTNLNTNTDIYQKDLQTGELRLLTPHGVRSDSTGAVQALAVSDDGQSVLFQSKNPGLFGDEPSGQNYPGASKIYLSHTDGDTRGDDGVIGTQGADRLEGGAGDDVYWINHANDSIVENASGGVDWVLSLVAKFTLPDYVENLKLASNLDTFTTRIIEANGNGLNNRLIGNQENNILRGFGGDDRLDSGSMPLFALPGNEVFDGGDGSDTLVYRTLRQDVTLKKTPEGWQILDKAGTLLKANLLSIERIEFKDQGWALPGDNHAAQAFRIYQAAFNRTPDSAGLGFWVKQIDNGLALSDIAKGFIQSGEFKALYGSAPGNPELVNKFYQNVLHRAPDAGGLNFWVDVLNTQRSTPEQVLAQFAESPENRAALTGVIDAGFGFALFA